MATDRSPANASGRPYLGKVSVGTGAGANTNIAVTGIRRGTDVLDAVVFYPKEGGAQLDKTSKSSITSDGNVQVTETTAEGKVVVYWRKRQP